MSRSSRLGGLALVGATTLTMLLVSVDDAQADPPAGGSAAAKPAAANPPKKKKKPKGAPSAAPPPPPPEPEPPPPPPEPPPPPPEEKKDDADKDKKDEKPASTSNISARVGSEIGGYTDSERVTVFTPSLSGSVYNPTAGWNVSGSYLVDVVSAASADVVATASPRIMEVRHAGGISGEYKPGELGGNVYASVSREPDYLAWTAGTAGTYEIFEKNAVLLAGYTYGHDIAGRSTTPFSVFSRNIDTHSFKVGLTYVVNRRSVLSFILDGIFQSGDTSKPYRYVPLFAPGVIAPPGISVEHVNDLRQPERALEMLPQSRNRYAFSTSFANRFDSATLRIDERLYTDSWGIKATSTDVRFLADVGQRITLGPHVRLHSQTPVNFWQRAYISKDVTSLPSLRTGDRELGPLTSVSGGTFLRVFVGSAGDPHKVGLGFDTYVTYTSYPDDLYIQSRLAALGAFVMEVNF